jgi:hypothetical protein
VDLDPPLILNAHSQSETPSEPAPQRRINPGLLRAASYGSKQSNVAGTANPIKNSGCLNAIRPMFVRRGPAHAIPPAIRASFGLSFDQFEGGFIELSQSLNQDLCSQT